MIHNYNKDDLAQRRVFFRKSERVVLGLSSTEQSESQLVIVVPR